MPICQRSVSFKFIPSTPTQTCAHAHMYAHSNTIWGPQTNRAKRGHCLIPHQRFHLEVTLCSWQIVKIQLVTNYCRFRNQHISMAVERLTPSWPAFKTENTFSFWTCTALYTHTHAHTIWGPRNARSKSPNYIWIGNAQSANKLSWCKVSYISLPILQKKCKNSDLN